jgi:hypothetical protein
MVKELNTDNHVAQEAPKYNKENAMVEPAKRVLERTRGKVITDSLKDAESILSSYGPEDGRLYGKGVGTENRLDYESIVDVDEAYELLQKEANQLEEMNEEGSDVKTEMEEMNEAVEHMGEVVEEINDRNLDRLGGLK